MSTTNESPDTTDDRTESLAYVAENYDGVVGAAAEMLLQSSEEESTE